MKKFIKSQTALQVVACAVIATFVIAGVVSAASTIGANVTTTGTLSVTGASTLTGAVTTGAGATVGTDLTVTSGTRVGTGSSGGHVTALADDSLLVEGQTEFDGTAWFDGSLRASSTLMVTDAATLYSTFNVAGATTLDGNVTLGNGTSDIITPTGYFTYARIGTGSTFGNIGAVGADELGVEGNVEVDGTAWFDGALTNAGLGTFSGGLTSTATTTISGRIQGASPLLLEGATANDGFETTIAVTDPTADNTITLPNGTGTVYITGGTDVTVADGGTGASTLTDGGILLGSGTDAVTPMAVLTDGQIVVGDGTTDPVALAAFTSSTGQLKHESGGLEADVSAYSGLVKITGGAASAVTVTTAGEALLDDANAAAQLVTLGVTSDAAELNILDGVTAAAAELNYVDITTLGTAASSKALTLSSGGVLTLADAQLVDFGAIVHNDAAAQGLRLPNSAGAPTAITANPEGHIAWDATNDLLYVSTGAGWASTFNNTASANTWTDNQIYTFAGDEDIVINSAASAAVDIFKLNITSTSVDAIRGIVIDGLVGGTEPVDAGIQIIGSDTDAGDIMTSGLILTGTITTALDASAANITTALKVDANDIVGTTGLINYTNFDVDAAGNITVAAAQGLDTNAAGALELGVTNATSIDIGVTTKMTTVKGTLNVDEAVTFDSTLVSTGLLTANGGVIQDYYSAAHLDAFSAAGLNIVDCAATTADLATITSGVAGQVVTLIFNDAVTVTDNDAGGANTINLAGTATNLTAGTYDTLTIVSNGTYWVEISRSVN